MGIDGFALAYTKVLYLEGLIEFQLQNPGVKCVSFLVAVFSLFTLLHKISFSFYQKILIIT